MSSKGHPQFEVQPGAKLCGTLRVPGDKSISHRALMLGAIAEGVTDISGFLGGEDTLATVAAFRTMGVRIERTGDRVVVHGAGLHGLKAPAGPLNLGNSGTSMRLLTGLLAGQKFDTTLVGDESLSKRPMRRVVEPLSQMGARIDTTPAGTAPLYIHGDRKLAGIDYEMPVASAQVKSCLLLAGLYASGVTTITEPAPSRDHTERMLKTFGVGIDVDGIRVSIHGGQQLRAAPITVPADISSAAFFMVGAAITPGSDVTLKDVGVNPTRTGIIDILKTMGADLRLLNERTAGGEPVADIRVRGGALCGIRIDERLVPSAIDEFPAIFIAAAAASGETVLTGAAELRVKESDRIAVMAEGLQRLGIDAQPLADGMRIMGKGGDGAAIFNGGEIDSHGDHRVAMSFAIAALRAAAPIKIRDCANVATSFPGFVECAQAAGLAIRGQP
ncbi:MAG TPA: 3-phosphoshikimate 1-carboxyvinyltransferase [Gammaproteobacteria bacterium]|nr:3-phosphoshikimate 1-carboxyvinyltransferase [Gammaproteobacteria bacterium]